MNFALILFIATLVTGALALADRLVFSKRRAAGAPEPWWIEYPKSFFPVLLIVFLLRSFVAEPFKIPSSSMRPTLEVGDFILVNKFVYGIGCRSSRRRSSLWATRSAAMSSCSAIRSTRRQDFIKRVIGVGGDTVVYKDKQLTVNGVPWPVKPDGIYSYLEGLRFETLARETETVDDGQRAARSTISRVDPPCRPSVPAPCGRSPDARTAITIRTAAGSPARFPRVITS